jgi:uncharacterized membrane protein
MKRRAFRSLLLGVVAGVCGFVAVALAFAVVGLWQSGHGGQAWTDTMAIDRLGAHLTTADLLALAAGLCAGVVAFVFSYRSVDVS